MNLTCLHTLKIIVYVILHKFQQANVPKP